MTLPKLVRDLVPSHIENDGRVPLYSIAEGFKERISLLYDKMEEEVEEFIAEPCLEEAGDIYEVLRAVVELHGMRMEDVVRTADRKVAECGGFKRGIILEAVTEDRPVDVAIAGQEEAYEEEIELHKTYGGD
jgi:predicted house-cleaning noncanonical NTP pyrophosphatase (MazG superfamily)